MSLLDILQQQLGQNGVQQISQQIGANPAQTQSAIQAALPMILGGMAQHAQSAQGAAQVQQAVSNHSGVLDNLGALIGAGAPADGGGLLGRVLGTHQDTVQNGVQQASGLDQEQVKKLLMIAAPLALGVLAHQRRDLQQGQSDPQDVASTLQDEAQAAHQQVQQQSPQLGGIVGRLLGLGGAM